MALDAEALRRAALPLIRVVVRQALSAAAGARAIAL